MLFTGNGDTGYTKIIGGISLPKDDQRIEIIGALDETQAHLGLARALLNSTKWADPIKRVQAELYLLMTECAAIPREGSIGLFITQNHIKQLEDDLTSWETMIDGANGFVTPGDTVLDAHLHLARTIIRRVERQVIALQHEDGIVNRITTTYLNRLSSWIYTLAIITRPAKNVTRVVS
ncbi:MAG: cob(I)yrinic acid a,c-diamide adenosyltransferase [Armatimonadota bacterium]